MSGSVAYSLSVTRRTVQRRISYICFFVMEFIYGKNILKITTTLFWEQSLLEQALSVAIQACDTSSKTIRLCYYKNQATKLTISVVLTNSPLTSSNKI